MTRTEAVEAVQRVLCEDDQIVAQAVLDALDPCLTFTPEIAEMSAVCHGVARVANEE